MIPPAFLFVFIVVLQLKHQITYSCNHSASCGCSNNSRIHPKIVGGQNAKIRTWTWTVSLRVQNRFVCAGTLISNSWILTAGHCFSILTPFGNNVFRIDPSEIVVHAGSIDLREQNQIRRVLNIVFHPKFQERTFNNDIALLQLSSPFDLPENPVNRICLPVVLLDQDDYPMTDSFLVAVGWGRTSEHGRETSILQQVVLKTIDYHDSSCYPLIYDSSIQFCAGTDDGSKDTCQGDSGGPLMMYTESKQWVLAGITSYGFGCAQIGYSGVYTRVSAYVHWINRWINDTDNSSYPSSLIYNSPYDDDDLDLQTSKSYRYLMSFSLTMLVCLSYSYVIFIH